MQFSFTSEQEEFRSVLRRFLEEKSPPTAVRRLMETETGWDRDGLARAQPAARPDRPSISPRPTAARASASSNSASCWRRWAAPCSAPRISPRPCWRRRRS